MLASIRTNHFQRWELGRTTISAKRIKWSFILLRVIPLTFLTLVALIPAYFYIDDSRIKLLPLMAVVLLMPRPLLAIRTIFMGIQSVRQDMIQQRWEPMILTGVPARSIVWSKWKSIVWQTLPDQILFALPSIGLAIGISQFFQISDYCTGWPPSIRQQVIDLLLKPYCYYSNQAYLAGQLNPSRIVIVIGMMLILIITFFETGLISSIAILAGLSRFAAKGLGIIYGSIIHLVLLFVILLSIPLLQDGLDDNFNCFRFMFIKRNDCEISSDVIQASRRVYDTGQLAVMSLLDQGTLLAANVMRPNDNRLLRINLYMDYQNYRPAQITSWINDYDNRPLVLRNLIAAAISAFFYFLLIRYYLRRAARFAIVNHGASGYLEL